MTIEEQSFKVYVNGKLLGMAEVVEFPPVQKAALPKVKPLLYAPSLLDGPGPFNCWRCGNDIREDFPSNCERGIDIVAAYDWLISEGNICSWCWNSRD
jgi:hypothetical protein